MNIKESQDEGVSSCVYERRGLAGRELPSEPPHHNKKPKDEDNEDDIPQPSTALTLSHIIHAPKRASENARRFRKCVVHLTELDSRLAYFIPNPNRNLLEHFYFGAEALDGLVVLAFEVICETCVRIGRCGRGV